MHVSRQVNGTLEAKIEAVTPRHHIAVEIADNVMNYEEVFAHSGESTSSPAPLAESLGPVALRPSLLQSLSLGASLILSG